MRLGVSGELGRQQVVVKLNRVGEHGGGLRSSPSGTTGPRRERPESGVATRYSAAGRKPEAAV
jgi:hypothetical protein